MKTEHSRVVNACRFLVAAALLLALALATSPARAAPEATFVVNTTADTVDANPGDGVCADSSGNCSLRAAIREANALSGADTITLPAGTYLLTLAGASEDGDATGDLDIRDALTINGAGAAGTIVDGNQLDRVFHIEALSQTVVLDGLTITGGKTPNANYDHCGGGGIFVSNTSLTLRNSLVTENTTGYHAGANNTDQGCFGGGIYREGSGVVTIEDSTIRGNTAGTGNNQQGGYGGGLYNYNGTTIIRNSTLNDNASGEGTAGYSDGQGGGIYVKGGGVTVQNSTISGNTAGTGTSNGNGGGIGALSGTVSLIQSTVTNNTGQTGGGIYQSFGTANIKNSIIAGNNASSAASKDCNGTITSQGYNLVGAGTGCPSSGTGDQTTSDARLGPLQDNGGPTETHALQYNSRAVGQIPNGINGCGTDYTTDQRGSARPAGSSCDVGAVETPYVLWDGGGADNNTSTAANWSGDTALGTSDIPVFSDRSSKNASVDGALTVAGWIIDVGYTGAITAGGNNLTINGPFTQSGGSFTAPTGLMIVSGAYSHTGGTFNPNTSGRVVLASTTNQTVATTFNDLVINDGLIGYWKLDEGSGTTAADASGYGHAATLYNSPVWNTTTPTTMDFHDPYSLQFNRTDSAEYVLTGSIPRLDQAQNLTLSAWVRLASTPGGSGLTYMRIITLENEKAVLRYYDDNGAGKLHFYMKIGGSLRSLLVDRAWATNTWYHVAGTYDGSTMRLYLNGTEQDTLDIAGAADSGGWIRLSHSSNTEALDGLLDDVRIYDRALSPTEISDLAAGKHPQTSLATTTLGDALDVNGDLTLNSGTLDVSTSNYAITLAGDFIRNGGIFTRRNGAVIFDGSGTQTLDTDAITFYNLTVNSGTTLVTRRDFSASTLTNNGTLQQAKNVVSSGTSFLWFGGYGGLIISDANLGETTVTIRGNQDCTINPGETVQRCYDIAPANTGTARVQFYFAASELSGNTCNTLNAYRWDGATWQPLTLDTSWGGDGRVCESAPYSVRVYPVTAFGAFVLKSPAAPARVTGLAASENGGALRLDWAAVTRDLDGYGLAGVTYTIYRGVDAPFFEAGTPYDSGITDTWWVDGEDVIGDPAHNYTYLVRAVANGLESDDSYRVGTFAFGLTPGSGE